MLYATNRFPGDGMTTQYEISFVGGYLDRTHVKAYVESADLVHTPVTISSGNFLGPYTIGGLNPIPVGSTLVIYRDTPKAPIVDFVNGSRFTESNLDTATRQGSFIAAEGADAVSPAGLAGVIQQIVDFSGAAGVARDQAVAAKNTAVASSDAASLSESNANDSALSAAADAASALNNKNLSDTAAFNASSSASLAQGFRNTASTHATNAGNSATAAAGSATTASNAQAAVATSASNAAASAASASASATQVANNTADALASKNAAAASALSAATSATQSANSATASAGSATSAATARDSAISSATNAGTSASTATTQAGIATTKATEAANSATLAGQSQTAAAASAALAASYAPVNVRALGAVGDGVADDTAAFNNAPSGVVLIPAGTYRLAGWVPKSNTTYRLSSGATLTQANNGASIVALANGAKNITFSGGTFRGLATSSAGAISIFDTHGAAYRNDLRVDSCTFDNFGGMALVFGGAKGWSVRGCIFRKTAQLNIPSGGTSYPAIWCSDNQAPGSFDRSSDGLIEGCVFEDMYWSGVYALGLRISIRNSQFRNTRESAIFISHFAERISVTGCNIDGTTMQNISASGVEVGGDHVVVSGNRITNCGAYGVSIQDARFFNVTSNLLAFNQTGIAIISSSASRPPAYGVVKANTVTNSTQRGLWLFTVAGGGPFGPGDYSGNSVTGSGGRNFDISSGAVVPNALLISYNTPLDSGQQAANVNVIGLPVGTGRLLTSFNFRPRQIACVGGNPGPAARLSWGTCEVLPGGGFAQACQGVGDTGVILEEALVSIAYVFKASVTAVTWNPTTAKWDVFVQVAVNAGVAVYLTLTATP